MKKKTKRRRKATPRSSTTMSSADAPLGSWEVYAKAALAQRDAAMRSTEEAIRQRDAAIAERNNAFANMNTTSADTFAARNRARENLARAEKLQAELDELKGRMPSHPADESLQQALQEWLQSEGAVRPPKLSRLLTLIVHHTISRGVGVL